MIKVMLFGHRNLDFLGGILINLMHAVKFVILGTKMSGECVDFLGIVTMLVKI